MSLTEVKLKNGILAILLAAVMIFSAFAVCADSNIAAAEDPSEGGGSGDSSDDEEVPTLTFSQMLETAFGALDGTFGVPVEKNENEMTVLKETVTVSEPTTYDKPVYVENNTTFSISSGSYLIFKDNLYFEGAATFNVSSHQKIAEFGNDSKIYVGGISFIDANTEIYSSSFTVSSQYSAGTDAAGTDAAGTDTSYFRNYEMSFDIAGTNGEDSFIVVQYNGTADISVSTLANNISGNEIAIKTKIDADAFVKAYGADEFSIYGALNVLKGLAENKATMPEADISLYMYSGTDTDMYSEAWTYGTDAAPKCLISCVNSNFSAKISTVEEGKYLSISLDADKLSPWGSGSSSYATYVFSDLSLEAGYSDEFNLSLTIGQFEMNDVSTFWGLYGTVGDAGEDAATYTVFRDINEWRAEGFSLTADGSASGVIGLADCVMQNMGNFGAYSEYLKTNTISGVFNAEISLTKATTEYHFYRVEDISRSTDIDAVCYYTTEKLLALDDQYDTRGESYSLDNFEVTLTFDSKDKVALGISGDLKYQSIGFTGDNEDDRIEFDIDLEIGVVGLSTMLLKAAEIYQNSDLTPAAAKEYLDLLSDSEFGPYSLSVSVPVYSMECVDNETYSYPTSYYTYIDSVELNDFEFSVEYDEKLKIDMSIGSFEVNDQDMCQYYYGSSYVGISDYQTDFLVSGVSVKVEAEQSGFVSLISSSITDEFKFDATKFMESADAYGDFTLKVSVSDYGYNEYGKGWYVDYTEQPELPVTSDFNNADKKYNDEYTTYSLKDFEFSLTVKTSEGVHAGFSFDSFIAENRPTYISEDNADSPGVISSRSHYTISAKDVDLTIDADYKQFLKLMGLIGYVFFFEDTGDDSESTTDDDSESTTDSSDLTEDQWKTIIDAMMNEITVSAELSFNSFGYTLKDSNADGTVTNAGFIFFGTDSTPVGQDKAVILTANAYTKNTGTQLKNNIGAEVKIAMADNAYFLYRTTVNPYGERDSYSAYDADFRISVTSDIDLWELISKDNVAEYILGLFSADVAVSADKIGFAIDGFSGELTDLDGEYKGKFSEVLNLCYSLDEMHNIDWFVSAFNAFDAEIGSLTVCYGTYDAESATIDKTQPYSEVAFYDGVATEKDGKPVFKFAYRTVNSTVEDRKISNILGADGKYAGTAFVFDEDSIIWTVFPGEDAVEPVYEKEKVFVTVPTVTITGAVTGTYPAGIQMTVKAVNDEDCVGWVVGGKLYALGDTIAFYSDSEIVEKSEHTVTFVSLGKTVKTVTGVEGTAVTEPKLSEREGYVFAGWDKTVTVIGNESVTVTAVWNPIYTVTFVSVGQTVKTVTGVEGTAVTEPKLSEREGYVFAGWNRTVTVIGTENITVTAVWNPVYTVTFVSLDQTVKTVTGVEGTVVTAPESPEREGYVFAGWNRTVTVIGTENVTVTAVWNPIYTVTFVSVGQTVKTVTGVEGTAVTEPKLSEREGYVFAGWDKTVTVIGNESVTVTAVWNPIYTVTFVSVGQTVKTVTGVEGTAVTAPELSERDGYVFAGWNRTVTAIGTEDLTVKALWTKVIVVEETVNDSEGSAVVKQKESDGVSMKSSDLQAILDKADPVSKNVVIELSEATIKLPETAVSRIAGDKDLTIKAVTVADVKADTAYDKLDESSKKLVAEGKVISITVDGAASVTELGTVKVTVPYTLKDGETADSIVVYYIDGSGTMTPMACGYADGEVWFETTHFSDYAIVSESQSEPDAGKTSDDDSNLQMYLAIVIGTLVLIAAVALVVRSRKA